MIPVSNSVNQHPDVQNLVNIVKTFAQDPRTQGAFETCGLYVVGSSLTSEKPNDIDVALVGLDFRALFAYDGVYLEDPESLIANEIILPDTYDPIPENNVVHAGRAYGYNPKVGERYDTIGTYCDTRVAPTHLASALLNRVFKSWNMSYDEFSDDINPLLPYNSAKGKFLCIRATGESVDFLIHAENMLIPSWKGHQYETQLPFTPLWKGERVFEQNPNKRYQSHNFPQPYFIDPNGIKRVPECVLESA